MYPVNQETFNQLAFSMLSEYKKYIKQVKELGYNLEKGIFEYHGILHILRVLFFALVYFYNSGEKLENRDKNILIYFSMLHDIGRTSEDIDEQHGFNAINIVKRNKIKINGMELSKKDTSIAKIIIQYHCMDDDKGIKAIENYKYFSSKDKKRAKNLYYICKDINGLDRVRFNGLDYRMLRTNFAKRLPLIADALLKENILSLVK